MKKIVYVDMDDTISDFDGEFSPVSYFAVRKMYEPGFFYNLKVIPGALSGVRGLIRLGYDVHILTQPVAESAHSYSEKVQWIGLHFPDLISKVHMTQNKGLFVGDYLVDDNEEKWKEKFEKNGGKFVRFDYRNPNMWSDIVKFFEEESKNTGVEK